MLKKVFLNYKTARNIKHRELLEPVGYNRARTVALVISDQFENDESISEIIDQLKSEGKETSTLVYCHNPKQIATKFPFFTHRDISLLGDIKKDELYFFMDQPYDFALCFDQTRDFVIDYVFSSLKAKCRIGIMYPHRDRLFEMMVHVENNRGALSNEVLKYLKMIKDNGL